MRKIVKNDSFDVVNYVKRFYEGTINGVSLGDGYFGKTIYLHRCRGLIREEERALKRDIKNRFPQYKVEVCLIPVTIGECRKLWYENL